MITNLIAKITIVLVTNTIAPPVDGNSYQSIYIHSGGSSKCPTCQSDVSKSEVTTYRHTNQVTVVHPEGDPSTEVFRAEKYLGSEVLSRTNNYAPVGLYFQGGTIQLGTNTIGRSGRRHL